MPATEGWFQLLVDAAPNANVVVDAAGTIVLVNASAEQLFGYASTELVGRSVSSLIPERYRGAHAGFVASYGAAPAARSMGSGRALFARRKDGREVPVEIGLAPLTTQDGSFVLASIIDVTARVQAEERARLLLEAAPTAIMLVDSERRIKFVNRRTEELFGYRREELVDELIDILVPVRVRERHAEQVQCYFTSPVARAMGVGRDLSGCRKDGSEFPIEIGLTPVSTNEGTQTLASIIDITARRQFEDELRRSNAELEQFAHIASHDLQEPLRMVASFTELLAERYGGKLDETADRYIRFAVDGAHRMQQLVADLLSYSRVGRDNTPRTRVDLKAVLADVWSSLGAARQSSPGATIRIGDLPSVVAAESQMRQLFQNLVGNSLKFRGDAPPEIDVSASRVDGGWEVAVKDNGIGFDRSDSERVFQMFQRLHGRSAYEGSGIGLAIAKRIAESHGGRIRVDSAPGEGSTFYVVLPSETES